MIKETCKKLDKERIAREAAGARDSLVVKDDEVQFGTGQVHVIGKLVDMEAARSFIDAKKNWCKRAWVVNIIKVVQDRQDPEKS